MPTTVFRSLAHESPLVRLKCRLPNGSLQQITVSSTFRQAPDYDGIYRDRIQSAFEELLTPQNITIIRVDHIDSTSLEIGHE